MTLTDYKNIWILAEVQRGKLSAASYELLTAGQKLANDLGEKLCAVLIGHNVALFAQDLISHGADIVYVCDDAHLENYVDDIYAKVVTDLIQKYKPNKFLMPATNSGRALSAKVAVFAKTGLTANATDVQINKADGQLYVTRPTFGGNLMATITCAKTRPEMCSLHPMSYEAAPVKQGHKGEVVHFAFDEKKYTSLVKFLEFIKCNRSDLDLSQSDIIVAGGRGVGNKEGFDLLKKLADRLGGAVAASRPPVDNGWADARCQIGLTGCTVKPKLYIACGISGQLQHMAGVTGADTIVAINKDPNAPIMKMAHYAVVGDFREVIPAMLDAL